MPALKDLYDFVENHAMSLENQSGQTHKPKFEKRPQVHYTKESNHQKCKIGCNHDHPIWRCRKFLAMNPSQRYEELIKIKVCHKCFEHGHVAKACLSEYNCKQCGKKHNSLLHGGRPESSEAAHNNSNRNNSNNSQRNTARNSNYNRGNNSNSNYNGNNRGAPRRQVYYTNSHDQEEFNQSNSE